MDNEPTQTPQQIPTLNKRSSLKVISLFGIGLLEFVFVAVILFLLFGTLNYFNILLLSSAFPQLSFLPRQSKPTPKNFTPTYAPTPTPVASLEKTAQQLFSTFVSQSLNSSIAIPKKLQPITLTPLEKGAFTYSWNAKESSISSRFKLSTNYKNLSSLTLNILIPQNTIPSSEFSRKITSQFFTISPKNTWECRTVNGIVNCENFWEENSMKRGIAVAGPITLPDNRKVTNLFFCEFHKDSPFYQWTSCSR